VTVDDFWSVLGRYRKHFIAGKEVGDMWAVSMQTSVTSVTARIKAVVAVIKTTEDFTVKNLRIICNEVSTSQLPPSAACVEVGTCIITQVCTSVYAYVFSCVRSRTLFLTSIASTEHVKWLYKPFWERKVQFGRDWTPKASYTSKSVPFFHHGVVCTKDRVYYQKLHKMVVGATEWNSCEHITAMYRILPRRRFVLKHACHIQSRCVSRYKVDRRIQRLISLSTHRQNCINPQLTILG
jgi:hypothetical protein